MQHEFDHLDGVLFPDRMTDTARAGFRDALDEFEVDFSSRRSVGEFGDDSVIEQRWLEWEQRYS